MPPISLAYLTYAPLPAPDAIARAARLGYDAVGLRISAVAPGGIYDRLIEDPALLRETCARIADTGVAVFDVEIVRLGAGFRARDLTPFFEICGKVGAKAVLVAGDDPDEAALTASFASFCLAAAPYGLTGDLEFMPWTKVPDATTARRIVERAAQPNARVLVDSLHAARSATTLGDIAALPSQLLSYAQICDAPAGIPATDAELIHTAREARLIPGEGGIDLVAIFTQLPADLPISVEIPNREGIARLGGEVWAARALAATRDVLVKRDAAIKKRLEPSSRIVNAIDLGGKIALLTGGCGGIGRATGKRFRASGATVVTWDRVPEADDRLDVTDAAAVKEAMGRLLARHGRLDILVNAAGITGRNARLEDIAPDEWRQVFDSNLTGTFLCCAAAVPVMRRQNMGRIVNLASIAGKEGNATQAAYSVAKAGVIALTKSLGKELAGTDVRANCIAPAVIATEMNLQMTPDALASVLAKVPLGRPGTADEVAAMIAWLSSDECSFSTGACFDLSGGRATY